MSVDKDKLVGVMLPKDVDFTTSSCITHITRYGIKDYLEWMTVLIPQHLLTKPDDNTLEMLQRNLKHIGGFYLNRVIPKGDIVACELLMLMLTNAIGVLRAHLDMPEGDPVVEEIMEAMKKHG